MTESRRRFDRVPYFESCTVLRKSGESASYKMLDLGAGGFAVQCEAPFQEGEEITAVFGESIREEGIVTHCDKLDNGMFQIGINFVKARGDV